MSETPSQLRVEEEFAAWDIECARMDAREHFQERLMGARVPSPALIIAGLAVNEVAVAPEPGGLCLERRKALPEAEPFLRELSRLEDAVRRAVAPPWDRGFERARLVSLRRWVDALTRGHWAESWGWAPEAARERMEVALDTLAEAWKEEDVPTHIRAAAQVMKATLVIYREYLRRPTC